MCGNDVNTQAQVETRYNMKIWCKKQTKKKMCCKIITYASKSEVMQNTTDANKKKKKCSAKTSHYSGSAPDLQEALSAEQPNAKTHRWTESS